MYMDSKIIIIQYGATEGTSNSVPSWIKRETNVEVKQLTSSFAQPYNKYKDE